MLANYAKGRGALNRCFSSLFCIDCLLGCILSSAWPDRNLPAARQFAAKTHVTPERDMGRYALLWLLGVPIPILLLIYLFGGLH